MPDASTALPNGLLQSVALPASRTRRKHSFFSREMSNVAVTPAKQPEVDDAGFPVHENAFDLLGLPLHVRVLPIALDRKRVDTAL